MATRLMPMFNGTALDELDRCFSDASLAGTNVPASVWEEEGTTYLELDLPGVKKDALEIVVENGVLTVTAERKSPETERRYWRNERGFGRFERTFKLADTLDSQSIKAELADGVLRLNLTKKPQAQARRIEVGVA